MLLSLAYMSLLNCSCHWPPDAIRQTGHSGERMEVQNLRSLVGLPYRMPAHRNTLLEWKCNFLGCSNSIYRACGWRPGTDSKWGIVFDCSGMNSASSSYTSKVRTKRIEKNMVNVSDVQKCSWFVYITIWNFLEMSCGTMTMFAPC